ncbi:MAG: 1,2-phenylacetyl-CoA epoxidase subunit PaaE [Myxococcota bacterium]
MNPMFHPLEVAQVRRETDDAVSVAFAVPAELRDTFAYQPGQYLTLRAEIDGEDVRRTYSICSRPGERLRVAIKQVPGGRFSTFANQRLEPGTVLQVMPPMGRFTVAADPNAARHHVAFAAGSGITPVLCHLAALLHAEPRSHVTLFYGSRSVPSILFRDELCNLKDRYLDRFTVHHFLSRQPHEVPLFGGRLDEARIERIVDSLVTPDRIDMVLICGPGDMIDCTVAVLRARGVASEAIHFERFGAPAPPPPAVSVPRAADVVADITLDGVSTSVEVGPGETVLDAAVRAGLELPYACRGGVCATCRAKVTQGEVEMAVNYSLAPWEVDAGFTLTCQARPNTRRLAIDFDQT